MLLKELKMDKYTILFVLLLTIHRLEGQFIVSNIRGPLVFGNAKSVNEKGASVVNIVDGYEVDTDNYVDPKDKRINGPVVISGASSNGPLVISGARPGSIWVQRYQRPLQQRPSNTNVRNNIGQWYQYPSQWPTKNYDRYY